jgi:hypothetical protein
MISEQVLTILIYRVIAACQPSDRCGGYCKIYDCNSSQLIGSYRVGLIPPEKELRYNTLSTEKAVRLLAHPEHSSSWQSRDDAADKKPGAIRGHRCIYSFSGLPWEGDEAFMLHLAVAQHDLTSEEAQAIAYLSGNEIYSASI